MREIKFRAWDRSQGKMLYFSLATIYGYEGEANGVFLPDGTTLNENSGFGSSNCVNPDLTIMQFTGLLDKQGREIYEGDIFPFTKCDNTYLHVIPAAGPSDINLPIVFEDGAFGFNIPTIGGGIVHERASAALLHRMPVIGNVYENQELLK